MKKNLFLISLVSGIWFAGCYQDNYEKSHPAPVTAAACDSARTISFSKDVEPVFASSCLVGCHSSASGTAGVILDTWAGAKRQASNGQLVVSIKHSQPNQTPTTWMPVGGSLTPCQIGIITKWVNSGFPNN